MGQTKCPLRIRIDEHFKNFNLNEKFHNFISKHQKNYEDDQKNHFFLWNDVKILHKETNRFKRAFSEMVYIKKESDNNFDLIISVATFKYFHKFVFIHNFNFDLMAIVYIKF